MCKEMISNEYNIPVQLTNSDINNVLYSYQNDYNTGQLVNRSFEDFIEPVASFSTNNVHLENCAIEAYSQQDQNYVNLAFHMSPVSQTNTMPPPLYSPYGNTTNNNNPVIKNYNKRNDWSYSNHSMIHQGYESDDSNAHQEVGDIHVKIHWTDSTVTFIKIYEGAVAYEVCDLKKSLSNFTNRARHKILRNEYRFPFEHVTIYNRNGNHLSEQTDNFKNIASFNQQRNINGLNKTSFDRYGNNSKRLRRNHSKYHYSDEITRRIHGLMERFKSKAKFFQIHSAPLTLNTTEISQLDLAIWNLFASKAQTQETYFRKVELWKKLYIHIGNLYERYSLFMVGSTMSGLGTETSDIDMCLLIRSTSADFRSESVRCLEIIRNSLQNSDFVKSPEIIHAKVPILKFRGSEYEFEVDLNCNNAVGIRNTHLLNCYTQLDWRVRPLIVVVKLWAQANSINDAKNMTISSYSLALMVIHFLQCGVVPPVLPCLHGLYQDKFNPEREIHDIDIQEELAKFNSDNKQTLGELLLGFLQYYTEFPFDSDAISVRLATRISVDECRYARSQKNDPIQWKYLSIEEPFDFTNTARSVYDLQTFRRIQRVFSNSSKILKQTHNLDSILRNTEKSQR